MLSDGENDLDKISENIKTKKIYNYENYKIIDKENF